MAGITGDEVAQHVVFGSSAPLFVNRRVVVVAGHVGLELGGRKRIGAGGEAKIGAAVDDIKVERTMV